MGIKVENAFNGINTYDLTMTCNLFKQPFDHPFNRYGLFLTQGSQINDIGGDNSFPTFVMPNGNGFPADPDNSYGYNPDPFLACFDDQPGDCLGNVGDWQVPQGWYSIWDDNANSNLSTPSFQYYRFTNEFVGDLNNQTGNFGVYPNQVVIPTSEEANMLSLIITNPPPTCANVQSIPFPPLPRLSNLDTENLNIVKIYPNPTNDFKLILDAGQSKISHIEIINLAGKIVSNYKFSQIKESQIVILDKNLKRGFYMLKSFLEDGRITIVKFSIE